MISIHRKGKIFAYTALNIGKTKVTNLKRSNVNEETVWKPIEARDSCSVGIKILSRAGFGLDVDKSSGFIRVW